MRGRSGLLMRHAAYWAPTVVVAALLVGGIGAIWTHSLTARAGVRSAQPPSPVAGSWTRLADTPDPIPVALLRLPSGKVLDPVLDFYGAAAEIYSPTSDTWSTTSSYGTQVADDAATLLPNGDVALVGGQFACPDFICYQTAAILYDAGVHCQAPT